MSLRSFDRRRYLYFDATQTSAFSIAGVDYYHVVQVALQTGDGEFRDSAVGDVPLQLAAVVDQNFAYEFLRQTTVESTFARYVYRSFGYVRGDGTVMRGIRFA